MFRPRRFSAFRRGLKDYLAREIEGAKLVTDQIFAGKIEKPGGHGSLEWAITWLGGDGRLRPFLLQHHPDRRRRHARGRPAHRADARAAGPCRARRPTKRAAPSPLKT